jgi:hypothetical protein
VGQSVVSLKASIINDFAYSVMCNTNYEDDDTDRLDSLHFFRKESYASASDPSINHGRETLHGGCSGSRIAEQMLQEVNSVDINLFSVAYVSDLIASMCYLLPGVMTARHVTHP